MLYLYNHKNEVTEIRKNCFESIQKFSKDHFCKEILNIYNKAIKSYKEKNKEE